MIVALAAAGLMASACGEPTADLSYLPRAAAGGEPPAEAGERRLESGRWRGRAANAAL